MRDEPRSAHAPRTQFGPQAAQTAAVRHASKGVPAAGVIPAQRGGGTSEVWRRPGRQRECGFRRQARAVRRIPRLRRSHTFSSPAEPSARGREPQLRGNGGRVEDHRVCRQSHAPVRISPRRVVVPRQQARSGDRAGCQVISRPRRRRGAGGADSVWPVVMVCFLFAMVRTGRRMTNVYGRFVAGPLSTRGRTCRESGPIRCTNPASRPVTYRHSWRT